MNELSKLRIPIPCPMCGGHLMVIGYDAPLQVLKKRDWHICQECSYQKSIDDFKKELLCI